MNGIVGPLKMGNQMIDSRKSKKQLLEELEQLRQQVIELKNESVDKPGSDITERKQAEALLLAERDLAMILSETTILEETLAHCLEAAIKVSGMDAGGVYIVNDSNGSMDLLVHSGLSEEFVALSSHYDRDTENSKLVEQGTSIYVEYKKLGIDLDDVRIREGLKSIAVLPVKHKGRVIACLNVASRTMASVSQISRAALESLTSHIGAAIVRQRSDEELATAKAFAENIVETANTLIVTLNSEAAITTFNRYAEKLTGYTKEEVFGRNWFDIFVPQEDKETIPKVFEEVLRNMPESSQYENPIVTRDGEKRLISWSNNILRDGSGNINGVLSIGIDITDRKQAEDALRESESIYRNTIENASGVPYQLDLASGKYVFVGAGIKGLVGVSREEFSSQVYSKMILEQVATDPDGSDDHTAYGLAFWQGDVVRYRSDTRIQTSSGDIKWINDCAVPIHDEAGQVVGSLGILQDITDRKQAEEELRE
ncbi:MAG: hypothetical protein DRP45_10310, partial [Candidatus Zixiibacteriota bacterium]